MLYLDIECMDGRTETILVNTTASSAPFGYVRASSSLWAAMGPLPHSGEQRGFPMHNVRWWTS
jgi:hypothetical protein